MCDLGEIPALTEALVQKVDYLEAITTRAQIEADIHEGKRCPIHEMMKPCTICAKEKMEDKDATQRA